MQKGLQRVSITATLLGHHLRLERELGRLIENDRRRQGKQIGLRMQNVHLLTSMEKAELSQLHIVCATIKKRIQLPLRLL